MTVGIPGRDVGEARLVEVAREYTFDSAHQLPFHAGVCANLHGHTYRLVVVVSGPVGADGMVIDFADLDRAVRKHVIDLLDHKLLNSVLENPTAELVASFAWRRLVAAGLPLSELTLWETPRSWVRLRG